MQARPRPALLVLNVNAVSISAVYLYALSRPRARSLATVADRIAGQYAARPGSYLASAVLNKCAVSCRLVADQRDGFADLFFR